MVMIEMAVIKMVSTEIEYINKDFREENILGYSPMDFVDYAYSTFYDSEDDDGMLENAMAWTIESNSPDSTMLATAVRTGGEVFKEYSLAALYITIIFTIRLSILILSLPLFILVTVIAVIDGFAQRDIRRWTNGRESGFRYHVMKSLALPMFFLAWIIYLSIPFSIHPNFIVLPLALLYGFIVREGISWFKKYL